MLKNIILSLMLFSVIILAACSEQTSDNGASVTPTSTADDNKIVCAQDVKECSDGSFVSRDSKNNCEFKECPEAPLDPQIQEMKSKISEVQSYEFLDSITNHVILVKGDKTVIVTSDANEYKYDKIKLVNTIFLDNADKTAYAACARDLADKSTFQCGISTDTYVEAKYSDFEVKNPFDYVSELDNGKIVGEETCERRQCDIVEYTADGETYKMWVRNNVILPYKVVKVGAEGKQEVLVMYTNAAFNHLDNSDLTLSSIMKLVQ